MRIGSLCSGYGGLDMAVEATLGGEVAWVADIDPDASRILARCWSLTLGSCSGLKSSRGPSRAWRGRGSR